MKPRPKPKPIDWAALWLAAIRNVAPDAYAIEPRRMRVRAMTAPHRKDVTT